MQIALNSVSPDKIWQVHRSRSNNIQEIWVWLWSVQLWQNGGLGRVPPSQCFFVRKTRHYLVDFLVADFHKIWPWHVNPFPFKTILSGGIFRKFTFRVICPQKPHSWRVSKLNKSLPLTSLLLRGSNAERYSSLCLVAQEPRVWHLRHFLLDIRFQSYRVSKLPNFCIFCLLLYRKSPKTYLYVRSLQSRVYSTECFYSLWLWKETV